MSILMLHRCYDARKKDVEEHNAIERGHIMFGDILSQNPVNRLSIADKIDLGTFVVQRKLLGFRCCSFSISIFLSEFENDRTVKN